VGQLPSFQELLVAMAAAAVVSVVVIGTLVWVVGKVVVKLVAKAGGVLAIGIALNVEHSFSLQRVHASSVVVPRILVEVAVVVAAAAAAAEDLREGGVRVVDGAVQAEDAEAQAASVDVSAVATLGGGTGGRTTKRRKRGDAALAAAVAEA